MPVTFSTKGYAEITMLDKVADTVLKAMGCSGQVPGALKAEDLPSALNQLQAAIAAEKSASEGSDNNDSQNEDKEYKEPVITLASRALLLIELLQRAIRADQTVIWERR